MKTVNNAACRQTFPRAKAGGYNKK